MRNHSTNPVTVTPVTYLDSYRIQRIADEDWLWSHLPSWLNATDLSVALCIARYPRHDIPVEEYATLTRLSYRSVYRALHRLSDAGVIASENGRHHGVPSRWYITSPGEWK